MVKHTIKNNKKNNNKSNSFNFKKTFNNLNLKKYLFNEKILILILILIPMLISTHYRMESSNLDVTQQWAQDSYKSQLRGTVFQQINSRYPNLPQAQKNEFINQQIDEIMKQQGEAIQPQIQQTADYFKSKLQNENGNTYLLAIDPYLWLTEAENYVKNGHPGDEMTAKGADITRRNGQEPNPTTFNVHPWLGAQIYKVISFFNSQFTLQRSMFLLPVIIIALSIIPAFFLGRKIGGNMAGFIAGLLLSLNVSLLGRTPAGFSDTDAYIILFPLFIVWTFIEALSAKTTIKKYLWLAGTSITTIFFSHTWGFWWHIIGIILVIALAYFIQKIIEEWKQIKEFKHKSLLKTKSFQIAMSVITLLISLPILNQLMIWITNDIVSARNIFLYPLKQIFILPFTALTVKTVASADVWPNVLTTVAELNAGSWGQIIGSVGGKLFFSLGIIGVILSLFKKNSEGKIEIKYAALLIVWFFGLSLASLVSARFIALLAAPFAIAFGSGIGIMFYQGSKLIKKHLKLNMLIPKLSIIFILIFLLFGTFTQANQVARQEIPSMTDAWYDSLTGIKNDSSDGIITSWWDFGHWFVNVAQRKVTFDGGDQGKRIYWVGKSLMSLDVNENKDILRMLNCGQEEGYKRIKKIENDSYKATKIITTITYQNKSEAEKTLKNAGFSSENSSYVLKKTHCSDLIPQYYIVSSDMIGKAGVWAHFGGWNFTKAKIYNIAKNNDFDSATATIKKLGFTQDEAEKFYFDSIGLTTNRAVDSWISPWPNYVTTTPKSCISTNTSIICSIRQGLGSQQGQQIVLNTITINLTNPNESSGSINVLQGNQVVGTQNVIPQKITLDNGEKLVTYSTKKAGFPYEIVVVKVNGAYQAIIADPLLAKSAFTMLYFFDGKYMEGYTKLSDKTTFTGQKIVVYKVDLKK